MAFVLFLPVWVAGAYSVIQQVRRLNELNRLIPERVTKHNSWAAARRAEVKEMEVKAANAGDNDRDQLTQEAEGAREALKEAIAADRAEILKLWNEARRADSDMPRPTFSD